MLIKDKKKAALAAGNAALKGRRLMLRSELRATEAAIKAFEKMNNRSAKGTVLEREKKSMKNFLALVSVIAAAGATLGAAAYYLYKKDQELNEYEDLLYNDEEDEDFDTEDPLTDEEKLQDVISDIKEATADLAEKAGEAAVAAIDKATELLEEVKSSIEEEKAGKDDTEDKAE